MFEKTLPIGTIVLLKGAHKRVMIIGYCRYMEDDTSKIYDYVGCVYPEGYLSPDTTALFDHDQIDVVFSLGFRNMIQYEFQKKLELSLKNMDKESKENGYEENNEQNN